MILRALVKHYEDLVAQGKIAPEGWSSQKISYALYIDDDGKLLRTASLKEEVSAGKKSKLVPKIMDVPEGVKRSVGIVSNFLWDNSTYILGIDVKGNPERTSKCFEACKELHESILSDVDSPAASALLRFFTTWDPNAQENQAVLKNDLEGILSGGNLVFRFNGRFVHEIPEIRRAWQAHRSSTDSDSQITCLVTGQKDTLAMLHPSIKGIAGAQSSGASLVSFNAPSFCSFGHEQGQNAPTGQYAAFAYGSALNHLVSDRKHVHRVGDTTILFWAEGGENAYQDLLGAALFDTNTAYSRDDISEAIRLLAAGRPVFFDETRLDPERPFYILGISPNSARLSVRFFLRNTFGSMAQNVHDHQSRLEIARHASNPFDSIPIWVLLDETVNQNSKEKNPSPILAGDLVRSVLTGTRYPTTLLSGITLRIRADHIINRNRAAILKAYYLNNPNPDVPKEALTVALNPECTSTPYQLGRLFAVLEQIQQTANPGINTTIKDKYFNSACAMPATVFPTLVNLAQKHLRKIGDGLAVTLNRSLQEIMNRLPDIYPARMTLPEQGAFQLGYYHQTVARYAGNKKEEQ